MPERHVCKEPAYRSYSEGGVTYKDRPVECNAPITRGAFDTEECSRCGAEKGLAHRAVGCEGPGGAYVDADPETGKISYRPQPRRVEYIRQKRFGFRCANGHWSRLQ